MSDANRSESSKTSKLLSPSASDTSRKGKSLSPSASETSRKVKPLSPSASETSRKVKPLSPSASETSRKVKPLSPSASETSRKLKLMTASKSVTSEKHKMITKSPSESSNRLKPIKESPAPSKSSKEPAVTSGTSKKPQSAAASPPHSPKKVNPTTTSSVDIPNRQKPRTPTPSVDTLFTEKPSRPTRSRCCPWCHKDTLFDEELAQIIGERKRKKSGEATHRLPNYAKKKDGCIESGYFMRPESAGTNTMEGLRKSCKVTKGLPSPQKAIEISNSKHAKQLKFKERAMASDETNVSEINKLLKNRLTGTINLDSDDPNEESEALLSYNSIQLDIQPVILSQLVQGADTRRISFTTDVDRSRRRSSFVLRGTDMASEQSVFDSVYYKLQNKLKDTSDADFINSLPKISNLIKNELESDLQHTQRYIKNLKTLFKNTKFEDQNKQKRTTERWMVILYTTSEERMNTLTDFNCNLVRLILQHHCVAYEERDIALKKQPFRNQLRKIMGTDDIRVPFVCAKGITVGGVQVIYAMHKMKLVNQIFNDFTMPPSLYADWLYRRIKQKSGLSLSVRLSSYPALTQILTTNYEAYLIRSDRQQVKLGKVAIKKAREIWDSQSQEAYQQPDLRKFVLLKNTIILAYSILNNIYFEYLPGQRKAELRNRCCRWCL